MNATEKNSVLSRRLYTAGKICTTERQAQVLRRLELTLHRWYELECGDSNDYGTMFCIERDEETDKPTMHVCSPSGNYRYKVADRENGAIKRLQALCEELGVYFYLQTDPRGRALYVSATELTDTNYSNGVSCFVA